ncbi:MAG: guanylate kinase [Planctomycetota bacterium]
MTEDKRRKAEGGVIVVISGPSGVGKGTICREVVKRLNYAYLNVSVTTRPKSDKEVDGGDYWFVSKEEFQRRIEKGMLLEHAEVFGNFYGTPKDKVDEQIAAGKAVILEIDVQGGRQIKAIYSDAVMIFILAPTQKKLAERLQGRARDEAAVQEKRLDQAGVEIAAGWQDYQNMVINDKLQDAVDEVIRIVQAARTAKKVS